MGNITDYLKQILSARYGKDVRQAIHDGIQQCYYDGKAGEIDLQARQDIESLEENLETVEAIAKGRNRARVFTTTEAMEEWLSASENIGVAIKGDNLYIVELEVPDWWIAEVLTEADAETGFYYKIAKLETQKVDLTTIESDIAALNESLNNFVNVRIYTGKGFATMAEDIYAEWLKLENGLGSVFLNNGATIFMGSYHRDSKGNMGSMILHENGTDNVYIWSTSGGEYSLDTVALNSDLANLRNIRVSDVLDKNSNPFPPNAFLDSALSLGYAHGSLMGLNVGSYIPILTMRWYETSEVVRTVQIAFDGITTHTRYSVSATEWGAWKSGATNSDFATKSIVSFITPNADFALGTTHNNAVKSGNVIKLNVFFYSGNNPIANGAIIGSVPSEYIPKYEQRMTVSLGARFGNRFIGTVVFKTDGTIVCDWQDDNLTEVGEIAIYGEYLI